MCSMDVKRILVPPALLMASTISTERWNGTAPSWSPWNTQIGKSLSLSASAGSPRADRHRARKPLRVIRGQSPGTVTTHAQPSEADVLIVNAVGFFDVVQKFKQPLLLRRLVPGIVAGALRGNQDVRQFVLSRGEPRRTPLCHQAQRSITFAATVQEQNQRRFFSTS